MKDPSSPRGHVWRFAGCEFDDVRRELRVDGGIVDLEAKPLDVLRQLLLHPGEVVTKDELLDVVWAGVNVGDASLATAVSKLRKVLGRDEIVVTVSRIGYRLAVPVERRRSTPPDWQSLNLTPGGLVPGREAWRLSRLMNRSASSEVWLAEHPKTRESRVFKFAPDEVRLRGLKREVTLARLLSATFGERREFVRVLEWNLDEPPYFLETEYGGPNLVEWFEHRGGLAAVPLDERLRLFDEIVQAVARAHEIGILHKDLKPSNILVSLDGDVPHVKVGDFGSASLTEPARLDALGITSLGFTLPGGTERTITGTVMYLAPEVLAGQSPTMTSDVYALGLLLYQLVAGDFRKPLAPGWEADVADTSLQQIIGAAATGDPARRLQSAGTLAADLAERDRARARVPLTTTADQPKTSPPPMWRPWALTAAVIAVSAVVLTVAVLAYARLRPDTANVLPTASAAPARARTVAVLPFQNVRADQNIDYLRLALPDEMTTILSQARDLSVRPFALSSVHVDPAPDLARLGRELGVSTMITGHFLRIREQLQVTFEAVDVDNLRVLSRHTLHAPADNPIAAQVQIVLQVRGGLLPALGAKADGSVPEPRNADAYDLFLRSAALAYDPATNADGIGLLERSVALDPAYAPAWVALARRYYSDARFGSGNPEMMRRYEAAANRLLELDPASLSGAGGLVTLKSERGDLLGAYTLAADLVRRRPDSAESHQPLSVVLRYAGLLEEAGAECDRAYLIDPRVQISGLRSCAIPFLLRGEYAHASNYLALDTDSSFAKALTVQTLVAQGREQEALELGSPGISQWRSFDLLLACIDRQPAKQLDALAREVRQSDDPEMNYFSAGHLAYCGRTREALTMLADVVDHHYCSYPAIDADPLLTGIRDTAEFRAIRARALACQQAFLRGRALNERR